MSQQPFSSNGGFVTPGNVIASTYTTEPNDAVNVQALFNDNNIGSKLLLDPNNTLTQLKGWSDQASNSWTTADWATGVYSNSAGTVGTIEFTGAANIVNFVNSLSGTDYVYLQVNGGPLLASQGASAGATNITFYVAELPATDPTTVTSFTYYYSFYSGIDIDYDSRTFDIYANDADINVETSGFSDINLNSARDLTFTGNGSVDLRNESSVDSINIVTDGNGLGLAWNYGNTGVLTLPGEGVIQSNNDTIILQSKDTGTGNIYSVRLGTNGGLYFANTEYPAGWLDITNNAGNASISSPISSGGAAGHNLTLTAGTTDQGVFTALPGGALNLTGGTGGFNDDGIGGPGGDVNIIAGSPGEAGGVAGNVYINAGTADWTFNNQSQLKVANLTIAATNGIGSQASIVEDNGSLTVLATGTNGLVNIGWSDTTSLGNTAVMWFNEPGNVGNAVIRTGNTADTSYTWAFDNAGTLTAPGNVDATGFNAINTGVYVGSVKSIPGLKGAPNKLALASANGSADGDNGISIDIKAGNANESNATPAYGGTIEIDGGAGTLENGPILIGYFSGRVDLSAPGSGTTVRGELTVNENANIVGNISAVNLGNVSAINLNSDANTVLAGDGTWIAQSGGSYGDANVVTLLSAYGSNTVSTTGNVTSGNFLTGGVVSATGNVRGANLNTAGDLSVTGNATVGGTSSNLTRRAYGLVAADVNVTLDDLSANVTSSTSQLALSTTGGWQGTGWTETFTSGTPSVTQWVNLPLSSGFTSASGAMVSQGQGCRCVISDQTPSAKVYQITVVHSGTSGAQWNISIERLV